MANIVELLDKKLTELLSGWNLLTTLLLFVIFIYIVYPVVTATEPDIHPLLLSRQASVAPVRQADQSAVYRSLETPYGYSLKTGLGIRGPGASRWSSGSDGDVRDIWRAALSTGETPESEPGKFLVIKGDKIIEHSFVRANKEMNVIGTHLVGKGARYVAIYLPNSVEFLEATFAAAFYGYHPVFIPFDKPLEVVFKFVQLSNADCIIAAAGSLPGGTELRTNCPKIREIIWVVEETSRELEWSDASEFNSSWHEIVEQSNKSTEIPARDEVADFIFTSLNERTNVFEIIALSQLNIVAAVAAQLTALPAKHRFSYQDTFLPAESLSTCFALVLTFAALYSRTKVALNTVAGDDVPLSTIQGSPTIIASTSVQAFQVHDETLPRVVGLAKYALSSQTRALQKGHMPRPSFATPVKALTSPDLRILYVVDRTNSNIPPMSSARLSDLRAFTNARVIHALTTPKVAGPVAQSHLFDYRREEDHKTPGHFGSPLACVELFVKDTSEYKTAADKVQGELVARGPAVQNGMVNLGIFAEFREDGCLEYLFQH